MRRRSQTGISLSEVSFLAEVGLTVDGGNADQINRAVERLTFVPAYVHNRRSSKFSTDLNHRFERYCPDYASSRYQVTCEEILPQRHRLQQPHKARAAAPLLGNCGNCRDKQFHMLSQGQACWEKDRCNDLKRAWEQQRWILERI